MCRSACETVEMMYKTQNRKLIDCEPTNPDPSSRYRELIVVEGDSASAAVARVRDRQFQAVLPMQGKPMNATKASLSSIQKNQWFRSLVDALGVGWSATTLDQMRYDRVLLLFDPDADGIHCGALMLLFFDTYLRPLLDANKVSLIKSPLFEIRATGYSDALHAYSEDHLTRLCDFLDRKGIRHSHQRYRGLASISSDVLAEACIDPSSRTAYLLQHDDAESARAIFGPRPGR